MVELFEFAVLVILGFLISIISTLIGAGGGFLTVPILVLLFDFSTQAAAGTSLVTILFTSVSATIVYKRQKVVNWKLGTITAALSIPGASLGALGANLIPSGTLGFLFGVFQLYIGYRTLRRRHGRKDSSEPRAVTGLQVGRSSLFKALPSLFAAGVISGALGVGGGLINVPVYSSILNIPFHSAVATSMYAISFTSLSGTGVHAFLGNIVVGHAVALVVGVIIGGQVGARMAGGMSRTSLQTIFGVSVLLIGAYMALTRLPF